MSIKSDRWIREMCKKHRMIEPFEEKQVRAGVISYGISSYGYDIRIAEEFKIFTNVNSSVVDPKHMDPASMVDFKGPICVIPPNSFALGRTVEHFRVPRNVLCNASQIHVRPLRDHHQRHAVRARVGGVRDARDQQHHAAAGAHLRQRGHRPGAVLRERRAVRDLVQGQGGEVPVPAGHHAAEALVGMPPPPLALAGRGR
jgi:hypothetical protein